MAAARSVRWLWLTLAVLAADRATKYAIERLTDEGFRRPLVPNFADLVHSVNAGIAFGLLSQSVSKWISLLLVLSSAVVISLLAWLLFAGHAGPLESQAGIALIAGGAAGNLLDRLLHGGVTDFLELRAGNFRWPAFNLADSAITIGAALIVFELLSGERHASRARI
jgi:signal peptidase II